RDVAADGKSALVHLKPKNAPAGDPSELIVGVFQADSPDAATAQLKKLADDAVRDGFNRKDDTEYGGPRAVVAGAKGTDKATSAYFGFTAGPRVGIAYATLPVDTKHH